MKQLKEMFFKNMLDKVKSFIEIYVHIFFEKLYKKLMKNKILKYLLLE